MSMFDKRKQGEEGKFARDQELVFKAKVRRNRMLGLWLAENFLSLSGAEAETYAGEVIAADFERPGDDDVVEFVLKSLEGKGSDLTAHRLKTKMAEFESPAMAELQKSG